MKGLAVIAIAAALLLPPDVLAHAVGAAGAAPPKASPTRPSLPGLPHPKVMLGEPGRFGGTFLDAQVADPRTFNPILAQETSSTGAIGGLFDGLVEDNGETTETEPALAESWRTSPDGRTWTFKLRQGLQWSDGAPVTADDVAFTFQVIYDGKIPNSLQDVLTVAGKPIEVTKVDGLTIRFRTAEPFGPFLRSIGVGILPRHKLDASYQAGKFNQTWGVNTPPRELVGTGAYVMTEYKPAQRITFARNPHYWRVDLQGRRLPYIERLVLTIVPSQEAHKLLFLQGQTDSYGVRPREYAAFKRGEKAGRYTVYDGGPSFGSEFLSFNQNRRGGLAEYKLKWFQNQKFRQGVAYAIDRQAIIDQVYAGQAIAEYGPESPADKFFFDPRVMQYPYDLDKAAATLAEAGFKKGADGLLRDADGHPVEFIISTNADNQDRVAIGNIIRQDLEKLGMHVTLAPEAFNTLVNKLVESYKWEAMVMGLTGGIEPHNGQNVWKSSGSLHMWNPKEAAPATPWEAEVDRYFNLAATTVDQTRRKAYYDKYQEIIAEQVPVVYTAIPNAYVAVRNKFGNIKYTAFGGPFWNFPVVYIKP
ncbi:MAG: ABC transporter substrate-binding protein [Bacillati bacterium ANGP1]|uniref:ABC transporter substrate-binding protein n=1 Tax=Candidatus Segetimicrobium genomatis TaxID=2569760 RepID=A0A537KAB8_9BACT|nr:MAG: ABC transporter substrate-binding protein [Terrabacteria group bacterium ANGP1]